MRAHINFWYSAKCKQQCAKQRLEKLNQKQGNGIKERKDFNKKKKAWSSACQDNKSLTVPLTMAWKLLQINVKKGREEVEKEQKKSTKVKYKNIWKNRQTNYNEGKQAEKKSKN